MHADDSIRRYERVVPFEMLAAARWIAEKNLGGRADLTDVNITANRTGDTASITVTATATQPIAVWGTYTRRGSFTSAPGIQHLIEPPDTSDVTCSRCGARRHRNYLLLATEDGDPVWVGQRCGEDCHRAQPRPVEVGIADPFQPVDDMLGRFDTRPRYDTVRVIAEAFAAIDAHHGYRPARYSPSTRELVQAALTASDEPSEETARFLLPAMLLKDWALEQADAVAIDDTSFLATMLYAASLNNISTHLMGALVYLPVAYGKEVNPVTPFEYCDEFLGEPKQRSTLQVTVREQRALPSGATLVVLSTPENHRLVWFTSGDSPQVGQTMTVRATVSRHDNYRGTKSTVINRVTEVDAAT